MIDPLNLAEIRHHVGLFLDDKDLFACIQVCSSWRNTFTPILYHNSSIFTYKTKNPTFETINKHADSIRDLKLIGSIELDQDSLRCSKLKTLMVINGDRSGSQQDAQVSPVLAEFIQSNKRTLKRFLLSRHPDSSSTVLWNALAQSKDLVEIWLRRNTVPQLDLEAFWEACSATDELTLDSMIFQLDPVSRAEALLPESFPKLKSLRLESIQGLSNKAQLEMIKRTPNLNALHWQPNSQGFPLDDYRQVMSSRVFTNLQTLKILQHALGDEDVSLTLDAMTMAKDLDLGTSRFSESSYRSLMNNHATTIQSLTLRACPSITSAMAQGILSGCPSLETLDVNVIQGTDLARIESESEASEAVVVGKDWVCLKLKYLAVYFDLSSKGADIDQSTPEGEKRFKRQQQLEQEHAFRQLSRLSGLKTLIFYDRVSRGAVKRSLELKLKSRGGELDQLSALKKLESIQFDDTDQDMSEEEIDWMGEHWPKLSTLSGTFHRDEKRDKQLKEYRDAKLS
ncbi:hypothetical protein BGX26_004149 [Mortierella sp. AD094]|nr:hypothetical protein BGX26_004149 [Mortierella sp. AD094]